MLAENNPAQTETPGDGEVGRKPTDPARPGADYGIAAARAGLLRKERLPALAAVQCSARREWWLFSFGSACRVLLKFDVVEIDIVA